MIDPPQILGILVNSDKYFDYVLKLAQAATNGGKLVRIHVLDKGFGLFSAREFPALKRLANVTACAAGMASTAGEKPILLPQTVAAVPPERLTDILMEFDRTVVF
jgi:hypothetical protein